MVVVAELGRVLFLSWAIENVSRGVVEVASGRNR